MPSESIIAVGIYVLGVVLIPLLAGIVMRREDIRDSDFFWNFCIPIGFISLTWPLVLMMAVGVIAVMIVVVMLPGLVFKLLIKIGQLIGRNMGKGKRIDRREDEEREHARRVLNAKPGDKEYFDYVCD